jgi:hypothetical protein
MLLLVLLFIFSFALPAHSQNSGQLATQEQSTFGTEEVSPAEPRVIRPVPVPDEVLEVLKAGAGFKSCLDYNPLAPGQLLSSWFIASKIHLDGSDETDLVVVPSFRGKEGMCFESVEGIGWFWVFRKVGGRYELALKTSGNGLEILKTKNNGYRNIQTGTIGQAGRFITTITFHFDGKAYRKYNEKT